MNKILIIDDDKELCALIKRSVQAENIEADFCNTGKEGLQKLREQEYQLVVLDVMMPGMDGFETLEEIRKENSLPILMFTSKNDSISKVRGLRAGADDYLTKPFDMFHDKSFIQALKNTAKLMAVVPVITIFCSLVLAFVLNQCKLKERVLYRTIFYFPNIVSLTVVGIIWSFVFHPNVGIINKILGAVGLESLQRSWLGDSKTALWCIAFTLLWQAAGYYMVMHIAAMDGISPEIYESATLDGASAWRKLVSITMPLMKDIIGITFVLALSGTINLSFVLSQVMTGGGPNGASSVLLQYMYTQGFVNGNFGYAMAITVFTLAISVALSMLSRKLTDASEGGQ